MSYQLLKSSDVAKRLNVGYSTFRTEIKHQPDFPKPIKLTAKAHPKWKDVDIEAYLNRKSV